MSIKDVLGIAAHSEKMLYDSAPLSRVYLHAYQASDDPFFRRIVEETRDYVLRKMISPEGGFYSTQDTDSEGEEGKFCVWTPDEVDALLGSEDGPLFRAYLDVTEAGNASTGSAHGFEHKNILTQRKRVSTGARGGSIRLLGWRFVIHERQTRY